MQLPYNIATNTYTAPKVFLCETDKTKIGELTTIGLNGDFKFNSYSEISCEIPREIVDIVSGESYVSPLYDKVEALRLLYLPGFGYFEIQNPTISSDGIKESKQINAYSYEYTLSQKYIVNFIINNPDKDGNIGGGDPSVVNQLSEDFANNKITRDEYDKALEDIEKSDPLVQFYDTSNTSHSLLHLALQKARGWTIGHVDKSLMTQTRSFEVDRESIYDFLVNSVAETFKCYFVFDTVGNTINVYAENASRIFNGDGTTTTFVISPPFSDLGDVTVDGYRTKEYSYNTETGEITFVEPPSDGELIEVNDGSQAEWQTDVFISFDNLASAMEVSYEADNIKTCLTVTGADDLGISDVNLGSNYIMDLSYFHTKEWMGADLYDAYSAYLKLTNKKTLEYTECLQSYDELLLECSELKNRVTTDKSEPTPVIHLTDLKLEHFLEMLRKFYTDNNIDGTFPDSTINIVECITEDFKSSIRIVIDNEGNSKEEKVEFLGDKIVTYLELLQSSPAINVVEDETLKILSDIWKQYGISKLKIYEKAYKNNQQTHVDSGWSSETSDEYYMYWSNYMMLSSCESSLHDRNTELEGKISEMDKIMDTMSDISLETAMEANFTQEQLTRLSAFIREDEYNDSNFVITDEDTSDYIFKLQNELKQCGQIELSNMCKPRLSFAATLANIYALPEFAPIIHQFQLGKLVNIFLRPEYIKKTRLMEVQINFEDLSDFSATFGDLISTRSQADIHADLLASAAQAGKSIAANEAKWQRASNLATSIDTKIQNGLLDANTSIKSTSPTQAVEMDQYGLHLRKYKDGSTTEYDPKQAWFVNNQLLFTDNDWKSTKTGIGEFTVNGKTFYGVVAEAMIAGYIEGSTIKGSTIEGTEIIGDSSIKIGYNQDSGEYNFVVDENGLVTFRGQAGGTSYTLDQIGMEIDSLEALAESLVDQINYRVEIYASSRAVLTRQGQNVVLQCKVYADGNEITDNIPASNFTWVHYPNNSGDTWEADNAGKKEVRITTENVVQSCNFSCRVKITDGISIESSQLMVVNMIDISSVAGLENGVVSLEEKTIDLQKQINSNDTDIGLLGDRVKNLEDKDIDSIKADVTALTTESSDLKKQVGDNATDIGKLDDRITAIEDKDIDSIQSDVKTLQDSTSEIQKQIENDTTGLEALDARVSTIEDKDIDTMKDDMKTMDETIKELQKTIGELQETIKTLVEKVEELSKTDSGTTEE